MDSELNKPKLYMLGVFTGAAVGLATAVLLVRTAEEDNGELNVSTSDVIKTAIGIVTTMRSVAALGNSR